MESGTNYDYDFAANPAYAVRTDSPYYTTPNQLNSHQRWNIKPEPPDSHYYTQPKPEVPVQLPLPKDDKTPVPPVKGNCNNSVIVTVGGLMMGFNFLLALCGVLIGTFAYLQSAGTSKEQPLFSYLSSSSNLSSSEVFNLQESFASMIKMIENMNKTMYSQHHLLNMKILEIHSGKHSTTGLPGIKCDVIYILAKVHTPFRDSYCNSLTQSR